jgi:hypothetical protein
VALSVSTFRPSLVGDDDGPAQVDLRLVLGDLRLVGADLEVGARRAP